MPPRSWFVLHSRRRSAFSLIEMLVVVALFAVVAGLAFPAFLSIGQARGTTEAAYQLVAAIEAARSEAVARQTFVWLGLQPVTNQGSLGLRYGITFSKDGSTNTNATNMQPLSRPTLIDRVALVALSDSTISVTNQNVVDILASTGAGVALGGGSSASLGLTFTPQGEATTNARPGLSSGFTPLVGLALRQARGTVTVPNNDAVILVDGSVGLPTLRRQ